jgi:hypothetical protein
MDVEVNLNHETLQGSTVLWLGFKEPVKKGFVFHLHSRFCHLQEVHYTILITCIE